MTPARRVGLLGGSFNPAHDGHRHVSLVALARLRLDEVWWMVSPQNPLKATAGMATMAERIAAAERLADHPRIRVTGIESELGTTRTVDTIAALRRRFRAVRFVWLMGADNLIQIPRWKQWQRLFQSVPIAVFPRPTYSLRALSGVAARQFAMARVPASRARMLADMCPPAWTFVCAPTHAASATAIRLGGGRFSSDAEVATDQGHGAIPTATGGTPADQTLLALVHASLEDDKADDVVVLDLAGRTTIADYMVIATGTSQRHVGAMGEHLREKIKAFGAPRLAVEGVPQCDWVLIDAGDVIVHLFRPEIRAFYQLEKMWGSPLLVPSGESVTAEAGVSV